MALDVNAAAIKCARAGHRKAQGGAGRQRFECELSICIHTYFAGDAETLLHDRRGVELRFTQQSECCRARKTAAGTDGNDVVLGFDDIACAGND